MGFVITARSSLNLCGSNHCFDILSGKRDDCFHIVISWTDENEIFACELAGVPKYASISFLYNALSV